MNNLQSEFQYGFMLHQRGQLDAAEKVYRSVLRTQPKYFDAVYALGIVHLQRQEFERAERQFALAAKINPDNSPLQNNRGSALFGMNRAEDALACYDRAVVLQPTNAEALYNRGNVLAALGRYEEAVESYDRAIALFPGNAQLYNNRGSALARLNRFEEAVASFDRAIEFSPNHAHAFANRGSAYENLKEFYKALRDYDSAFALDPSIDYALGQKLNLKMRICSWDEYEKDTSFLLNGLRNGTVHVEPLSLMALPSTAPDQKKCAEDYVAHRFPARQKPLWRGERYSHDRIRIGYVSSDFRHHAVGHLIVGLLENHDRSKFAVIGYSTTTSSDADYRNRIEKACETFVDAGVSSDEALSRQIRDSEIDILIDLNGHTAGRRTGVFATRPAPVQVNYLGYPGTMGADYIDYIVADPRIIPEADKGAYSEKVVYLPDSYQANDSKRTVAENIFSREEQNLPTSGFVFCCFNNSFKITPDVFDVWMRLLKSVEGSVLWLLEDSATATANLRQEAGKRSVSGQRLIFAGRLPLAEHLARHRLADLFLDTLYYNAHTTASDALWTGLPLVTRTGNTFASRVATSLLHAAGLPELAVGSLEDYEALALKLAADPDKLRAVKTKLANIRDTCPLFDTARYARHIEAAYTTMWERAQKKQKPASFAVEPIS